MYRLHLERDRKERIGVPGCGMGPQVPTHFHIVPQRIECANVTRCNSLVNFNFPSVKCVQYSLNIKPMDIAFKLLLQVCSFFLVLG